MRLSGAPDGIARRILRHAGSPIAPHPPPPLLSSRKWGKWSESLTQGRRKVQTLFHCSKVRWAKWSDVVQNLPIRLRQLFHDLEVGRDPALFESFMSIQTCSAETRIPISDQSASCFTMCGRWGGNVLIQHLPSCHCFPIHEIWFHSLSNLLHGSCERILSSDFIVPYPFFSIYGISSSHLW